MASKTTRAMREKREAVAWQLSSEGWTHQRIADQLVVDRSTVTKILQRVSSRFQGELRDTVLLEKMRQVEILHRIVDEAMQAWERSKGQEKSATRREKEKSGGSKEIETTQHAEENTGDPRYLAEARAAMADIRKILGLDRPMQLLNIDFSQLPDDVIDAIADGKDPLEFIRSRGD